MTAARRHDVLDWLMLLTLVAMWGTSFMVIEIGIRMMPAATLVAARLALGAVLLLALMWWLGLHTPRSALTWAYFVVLALLGNCIPFYLIAWGQTSIDSGLAGILLGCMPLATLLLAHRFVAGERITAGKAAGFAVGFAGLALLLGPEALATWRGSGSELAGQLACLGGALCYAANSVLVKRMPPTHALVASAWTSALAALIMVPFAWIVDWPLARTPEPAALWVCAWLAVGPTAIATIVYFRLIARAGPTFMSFVNYMSPVVAVITGALVLGEALRPGAIAALMLILSGIALATRATHRAS